MGGHHRLKSRQILGAVSCPCPLLSSHVYGLQGLEAVARLRVSSGLEVDGYGGAYYRRTAADIDLPGLNSDQVQPAACWAC